MAACLDDGELAALVDGSASGELRARIDAHVDGCARCGELVATLRIATEFAPPARGGATPRSCDIGDRVGRYEIIGQLGAGAMGVVWIGRDPTLGREVAIKLVHQGASAEAARAVEREARSLAKVAHPNVVAVHDAGWHGDQVFLAMERVPGVDLRKWLAETARSPAAIVGVFAQAARGVAAAHSAGIIHRDLKPDNIMVGDDGRVRVADFGLAHDDPGDAPSLDANGAGDLLVTATGALVGTPCYMAPERLAGQPASAASDQFALCVSLYEALHARRPFDGATVGELRAAMGRRPAISPKLPRWLADTVRRGLAADERERWPSLDALAHILARGSGRRRRWVAAGALGAAAIATLSIVLVTRGQPFDPCEQADVDETAWQVTIAPALRRELDPAVAERLAVQMHAIGEQRVAACRAQAGGAAPEREHRRAACLDRRAAEVSAAIDIARRGRELTAIALDRLKPVAQCSDPGVLDAQEPGPDDPQARALVQQAMAAEETAQVWMVGNRWDEALRSASDAQARAKESGYAPAIAEAMLVHASAAIPDDPDAAAAELEKAIAAAAAARAMATEAQAWLALATCEREARRKPAEAARALEMAQLAVERAGGDPELRAKLGLEQADAHLAAKDPAAARAALDRVIALAGAPDHLRALALLRRVQADFDAQDLDAADSDLARARPMLSRWFGPDHPIQLLVAGPAAELAILRGHCADAIPELRRYLDLAGPQGPKLDRDVLKVRWDLASCLSKQHEYREARAIYDDLLALPPLVPPSHARADLLQQRGACRLEMGDVQGALADARAALAITDEAAVRREAELVLSRARARLRGDMVAP